MKNKKERKILITIIFITFILDQICKIVSLKMGLSSIDDNVNTNGYYIVMSIIIIIMIIRYISNDNTFIKLNIKIILSLAISGAIGNLVDRICYKQVITFIKIGNYIHLNLAYIYIIIAWIGMAAILSKNTMNFFKERRKHENKSK